MIRRAVAADAGALAQLYTDFFAEDSIDVSPDVILKNLSAMLGDDRAALWIAEEASEIIGFVSATMTLGVEFGWASEIEDLYIRPLHRGQGLARALLQTAVEWADTNGAAEIFLVVTPEAEAEQGLIAFYEGLGFHRSDRVMLYKTGKQ